MKISVALVVSLLFAHVYAWGQAASSTAQIAGSVKDTSGLAVPDAQVKVAQTETGLIRTATTGTDGTFVLADLPVGPYKLEVSKDGFSTYVQAGIVLQVGSSPTVEVPLKVGAVTEQVQVEADATLVDTRSSSIGLVVDSQRVVDLPLNGRQENELVYLSGMANPGGNTSATEPFGSGFNSGQRNYPTTLITVAGGAVNGVAYSLDGGNFADPYSNISLPFPFPDAVQEFKIETEVLGAQYGRYSSAAVNVVTKSGTNSWHGDLFDYVRNTDFDARNAFSATPDGLKRNQVGGVIGGPIRHDKLFIFLGNQNTLQRIAPTSYISYVPTAAMRAGNFTAIASPQCNNGRQINLPAPFVNNTISPSLFSAPTLNILNLPGFPTSTSPCGQVSFGRPANYNEYMGVGRMDYQVSDKQSIFGRYFGSNYVAPTDANPKNLLQGNAAPLNFLVQTVVLGDTYLINSRTVNSFRVGVDRTNTPKGTLPEFDASQVGINTWVGVPGLLKLAVTGGFSIGSSASTPSTFASLAYQFSDDLSVVWGAHQFAFGGTFIHDIENIVSSLNAVGTFSFTGQVTGLGMADFMLGKAASFTQSAPNLVYERQNYIGIYGQDTWKATPRLTLIYGLRWDPFLPIYSKNGAVSNFNPTLFAEGVRTTQFSNAPAGLFYPGDPGYPGMSPSFGNYKNLSPRAALAWDPQGNGRTSIRASFGILYDIPSFSQANVFSDASPFAGSATVNFPSSFANPWAGVPGGNPFPLPAPTKDSNFIAFGTFENWLLHPKTPNQDQWNLSIQRQLGQSWLVQASYVGNVMRHLWGGNEANPAVYIPGSCVISGVTTNPCSTAKNVNNRRLLNLENPAQGGQDFGIIYQLDDGGTGSFNALVLSTQKRLSNGFSVQANYTWSHCISDPADVELGGAGVLFMIPGDRSADRSNCPGTDRRQAFVLSGVYQTPQFVRKMLRLVASDWQFSAILRTTTGPYVNVLSGLDNALTGQTSYERPNQVLPNVYGPNASHYLNPAAFAQPALGTYGNVGAFNILAPGGIFLDMSAKRTVKITERYRLQFRLDMFNVPNLVNLGTPTGVSGPLGLTTPTVALNSPQFGEILSANDPRILQGSVEFVF